MHRVKLLLPVLWVFLLTSCQSQSNLESRNKETVRRYVNELLNKCDYSRAHEIITPDFTLYDNGQEMSHKGVDLFRSRDKEVNLEGLSELVLTIQHMIAERDTVAMLWYDTARFTPNESLSGGSQSIPLKWHGLSLYRFRDGRIYEAHVMNDLQTIDDQIAAATSRN